MNINQSIFLAAFCLISLSTVNAQTRPINTKADFDAARTKIDSLDKQMIKTIGERQRIVREIGVYKAKNHIAPLQPARFKQVVDKAKENGKAEGLSPELIETLMNAIHTESLKLEEPAAVHNE
ncbi:chorismate mutase [Mucilaginibacter sp. L3T2-6]|uniref:chorismate mutase n=1 Tax=Mucilaginibacter sp. L3T2-6 TaxID=3062491 RepID=UPI002675A509|nr:chorismate mutase [Mucilaginibacter sp. L3T2-6]MDO3642606.1 chorismate mutase [Mucilaginibacter sp. L3T2-6]MDV6214998.1 chorismate mutase [Mucilaginibacter sp. L3T2-6]